MNRRAPVAREETDRARAAIRRAVLAAYGDPQARAAPPGPVSPAAWVALEPVEVGRELGALLMGPHAGDGLDDLFACGALGALLPEAAAMAGLHEEPIESDRSAQRRGRYRHKDLWAHTKKVVDQSARSPAVRWAALLHDIGKVETRSVNDRGEVHFLGHAEVGAAIARRILRRLGVSQDLARTVRFLVRHHLRANQYDPSWTDSAVRRFARETAEHLEDLLALSRADITTQRPARRREGLESLDELERRIREVIAADSKPVPLPKGLGTALIETFRLAPGPIVGKLRRAIEEAARRGDVAMQAPYDVYIAYAREHLGDLLSEAGVPPPGSRRTPIP